MSDSEKIGEMPKGFDMDGYDLREGEIVTDVLVIMRFQRLDDTDDALIIAASTNTGGIVCHGMLTSAVIQHTEWMTGEADKE